jgi:hypothetical protein
MEVFSFFTLVHPELDEGYSQVLKCNICQAELCTDATTEENLIFLSEANCLVPQCPWCGTIGKP